MAGKAEYKRKWYQKHRIRILEKAKQRGRTPEQKKKAQTYWRENRERFAARFKEWYKMNPEVVKKRRAKNRFANAINHSRSAAKQLGYAACTATKEEIEKAFTGFCFACGVPEAECSKRLSMDHCHTTGEFRGWLCGNCNKALGLLKDSAARIRALEKYLVGPTRRLPLPDSGRS